MGLGPAPLYPRRWQVFFRPAAQRAAHLGASLGRSTDDSHGAACWHDCCGGQWWCRARPAGLRVGGCGMPC
eukprot:533548-Pyramimonas_sp.AAC.1